MKKNDQIGATVCVILTLVAIFLTIPIAECGVIDDWSYTKTSFDLVRTGRLVYNGWAAAMLGAQAYWGALFVKLFGYSFLAVRLSSAPLAAGCAALLYAVHRRAELPPALAVFGTLTVTLSPLFVPMAASFMTDVPSLFLFLVSLYGYLRVDETLQGYTGHNGASSWRIQVGQWLLLATVAGFLSGTVRQVYWVLPILVPLCLLARHRSNPCLRSVLAPFAVAWVVTWLAVAGTSFWFGSQPYAIHEKISNGLGAMVQAQAPRILLLQTIQILLTLAAVVFPVLIPVPLVYRSWLTGLGSSRVIWGSALLLALGCSFFTVHLFEDKWIFPWLTSTFFRIPLMTGFVPMTFSSLEYTLPIGIWKVFSICVMILVYGTLALKILTLTRRNARMKQGTSAGHLSSVIFLFGVFAAAYVPILLLKGMVPGSGILDRYLIPLMPLGTIGLLVMFHRATGRRQFPLPAWLLLALFAYYGIAQTHDYFALLRTRLNVTDDLERRGIPRTRIMAGFEYDSWTQIMTTGYYNDSRIQKPKGIYVQPPSSPGFATLYTLFIYTPVVQPDYVVALSRHPELYDTDYPDTEFSCWLRPLHRRIMVQVRDPRLAAIRSLPLRPSP